MIRRLGLTVLAFVLVLAAALAATGDWRRWIGPAAVSSGTEIGGPFTLVDTRGRAVSERSLLGRPTAIFFGFTYCPEVCPTTLTELSAALGAMGPSAGRLNVVFVTVDPERDTPAQLKLYLSNFDPRIQGYTGSPAQVAQIIKAYRVYAARVPQPGGSYTMDHSSMIYLFDSKGRFVGPISYGTPLPKLTERLRTLAAGG